MRAALLILVTLMIASLGAVLARIDFDFANERVQQGAIAAAVVISGWFVTVVFRELGVMVDRRERSRDLQEALGAEIFDYTEMLRDSGRTGSMSGLRETDDLLFWPQISAPKLYDVMCGDIQILPRPVIDSVVQFYSVLEQLRQFIAAIKEDNFRELDWPRRREAYEDVMAQRETVVAVGDLALTDLEISLARRWFWGPAWRR